MSRVRSMRANKIRNCTYLTLIDAGIAAATLPLADSTVSRWTNGVAMLLLWGFAVLLIAKT